MTRALLLASALLLAACTQQPVLRGSGDLGVIIERARGSIQIVETSGQTQLARIDGLGDLSHASVVFSRDQRFAYVFGRDGGLVANDPGADQRVAVTKFWQRCELLKDEGRIRVGAVFFYSQAVGGLQFDVGAFP